MHRLNGLDLILHPNIPQLDLAVAAAADQLPHAAALHVHVGDPLLVAAVPLDHGLRRPLALVVDLDLAVPEAGHENVARYLIRG